MNILFDAEIALHMAPFIALGAAAIAYKIKWMRDERRVQRENHRTFMAAAVAEKEREQEYKCRVMMFEVWDEVRRKREYRERRKERQSVTIKGALAAELPESET